MQPLRYRHCYRLLLAASAAVLYAVSWSSEARAQVVIRERVEIHPDSSATGPASTEGPTASAWAGGVRGKGMFRFHFSGALLRAHPLSSLSATLTTTKGQVHSLTLGSAGQQTGERTVCHESDENPDWPECSEWTYSGGLLAEFHLDADEGPGTLHLTGPGVDLTRTISLSAPPYESRNRITDWKLNCGYTYYLWGPYHFSNCNCMKGRLGEVHGKISFRWEFTPDPAEMLLVTAADTLNFKPTIPYGTRINVQAAYADGEPAPLADNTSLTFTAGSTTYGSLLAEHCYYGCSERGRGATWTTRYRGGNRVSYVADGDDGSGNPPVTEGPVCDTPVTVSVSGDGISGETSLTIRGTGPSPSSDTLVVWTSPSSLAAGDSAGVFARHYTTGCMPGELPDSTRMAVARTSATVASATASAARSSRT